MEVSDEFGVNYDTAELGNAPFREQLNNTSGGARYKSLTARNRVTQQSSSEVLLFRCSDKLAKKIGRKPYIFRERDMH